MALLIPICCASCGQTKVERLQAAGEKVGHARAADVWPEYPADCREKTSAGVKAGERLDVAVRKYDHGLDQQNKRTDRCAAWYDKQAGKT